MLELNGTYEEQQAMHACATLLGIGRSLAPYVQKPRTQEAFDELASSMVQRFPLPTIEGALQYLTTFPDRNSDRSQNSEQPLQELQDFIRRQEAEQGRQNILRQQILAEALKAPTQQQRKTYQRKLTTLAAQSIGIAPNNISDSHLETTMKNRGVNYQKTTRGDDIYTFKKSDPSSIRASLLLMAAKNQHVTINGGSEQTRVTVLNEALCLTFRHGVNIQLNDDSNNRLSGEEKQLWDILNAHQRLAPPYRGNLSYLYQALAPTLRKKLLTVISKPLPNETDEQQKQFKEKLRHIEQLDILSSSSFLHDLKQTAKRHFDKECKKVFNDGNAPVFRQYVVDFDRADYFFANDVNQLNTNPSSNIDVIGTNFQPFVKAVTTQTLSPFRLPNIQALASSLYAQTPETPYQFLLHPATTSHIIRQISQSKIQLTTKLTHIISPQQTDQNVFSAPIETIFSVEVSLTNPNQPWGPENRETIDNVSVIIVNGDQSLAKLHQKLSNDQLPLDIVCRGHNDPNEELKENTSIADLTRTELRYLVEQDEETLRETREETLDPPSPRPN